MPQKAKSHIAIVREYHRVEQWWKKARRRNARLGIDYETRDVTRLEAARQALAWAAGEPAMSFSRIAWLNEQTYQRAKRRGRL